MMRGVARTCIRSRCTRGPFLEFPPPLEESPFADLGAGGGSGWSTGGHVVRDAALELRARCTRTASRVVAAPSGDAGQERHGRYALGPSAALISSAILAHPRLERLVEQRALHSVPERHERTVRTHAVLHTRFLLAAPRETTRTSACGAVAHRKRISLALSSAWRAWMGAGARTACARKRAGRRPHPRGGPRRGIVPEPEDILTSRRARSRRDDSSQPRRRRRAAGGNGVVWRRLLARAASDDVAERGVGGEPRGLSRASAVACVGAGTPTHVPMTRGDAPVDHRRRHVSAPTLPNFEKKISVVYQ